MLFPICLDFQGEGQGGKLLRPCAHVSINHVFIQTSTFPVPLNFVAKPQPKQQAPQQNTKQSRLTKAHTIKHKLKPAVYKLRYDSSQLLNSEQSVNAIIPVVIGFGMTIEIIGRMT